MLFAAGVVVVVVVVVGGWLEKGWSGWVGSCELRVFTTRQMWWGNQACMAENGDGAVDREWGGGGSRDEARRWSGERWARVIDGG